MNRAQIAQAWLADWQLDDDMAEAVKSLLLNAGMTRDEFVVAFAGGLDASAEYIELADEIYEDMRS